MQYFHKTAHKIFPTCFQSLCEFSKQMDNKCRNYSCFKIVCPKIKYRRYQQYWMCIACTSYGKLRNLRSARFVYGAKLSSISLQINLNQGIAQFSSCSDSNVQQTGLAQKYIPVVVLITMALIATQDFHRV